MAKSREKMLARMKKIDPPEDNLKATFHFPYENTGSANALRVEKLSVGYNRPLLSAPCNSSRWQWVKNYCSPDLTGLVKSTLIKSILKKIPALGGTATFSPSARINYFDQDLNGGPNAYAIANNSKYVSNNATTDDSDKVGAGRDCINAANTMKEMNLCLGASRRKLNLPFSS